VLQEDLETWALDGNRQLASISDTLAAALYTVQFEGMAAICSKKLLPVAPSTLTGSSGYCRTGYRFIMFMRRTFTDLDRMFKQHIQEGTDNTAILYVQHLFVFCMLQSLPVVTEILRLFLCGAAIIRSNGSKPFRFTTPGTPMKICRHLNFLTKICMLKRHQSISDGVALEQMRSSAWVRELTRKLKTFATYDAVTTRGNTDTSVEVDDQGCFIGSRLHAGEGRQERVVTTSKLAEMGRMLVQSARTALVDALLPWLELNLMPAFWVVCTC
jgi:hypothetical protein